MSRDRRLRPFGQSLAVVIFGSSSLPYLQRLKPGYQHCMIAVQDAGQWHVLDPLSNGFVLRTLGVVHIEEILDAFRAQGFDAVPVHRRPPEARELPSGPFTCVEAVKRVLGLRARWVWTPWQLRNAVASRHAHITRYTRKNS